MADLAKTEVKKHVGAIHVDGKLSLLQRKIANVLLWNAYDNLLKQEKHRIRIRDIALIAGFDSNDRELLKEALRQLAKTPLEWNMLHEDGEEEWGVAPMLSQAVIRGGYCSYAYAPDLREKFFNPEIYARINLGIQRNITSGYALTLYENCVRYRKVGSTGWIDLNIFKILLGVENSKYYRIFKHLNNKIIKPSIAAINKTSDIFLTVEFQREKRRISAVKFIVKENPQLSLFSQKIPNKELLTSETPEKQEDDISDRLKTFGVSNRMAKKYREEHSAEYIQGNLNIVERDYKAGKVKNLSAYTLSALKADYRPKTSPIEMAEQEEKKSKKQVEQQRRLEQQRLEQLRNEFEIERLQEALSSMGSSKRKAFEDRFHEKSQGDLVYKKFQELGMDHPVIQSLFRTFASKELLDEVSEEEFTDYAREQGVLPEGDAITVG